MTALSPYKFLDHYTMEDAPIFFGRERETSILLSDVLVSRLVVLFAETGTGKTSLINAGVRPELERMGYATFFIRVRTDPIISAREEVRSAKRYRFSDKLELVDLAELLVGRLKKSVVLFFDQFEEFFIYTCRERPKQARRFISDVAKLFNNRDSHVQIVLSMREDFFTELDVFRDHIPNIFHSDSNLRLRPFTDEQAREAIVKPALRFNTRFEPELVDRIIKDLRSDEGEGDRPRAPGIEPVQLQIVCDTLWQEHEGDTITLDKYVSMGAGRRDTIVAHELLYRRLEQRFAELPDPNDLALLVKLLPELRTRRGTKSVRDVETLSRTTGIDERRLHALLRRLDEIRFIRLGRRDGVQVVELAHDYLARRLDELQHRVALMWPRKILMAAFASGAPASAEQLETIWPQAKAVVDTGDLATFVLRSSIAAAHRMLGWGEIAQGQGVKAIDLVEKTIAKGDIVTATHAIELLDETFNAVEAEKPAVVVQQCKRLLPIIEHALQRNDVAHDAQRVFAGAATSRNAHVRKIVAPHFIRFVRRQMTSELPLAPGCISSLAAVGSLEAVRLMAKALRIDSLTYEAQDALARLVGLRRGTGIGRHADAALLRFVSTNVGHGVAPSVVATLAARGDDQALRALKRLARSQPLAARPGLQRLAEVRRAPVAAGAMAVLQTLSGTDMQRRMYVAADSIQATPLAEPSRTATAPLPVRSEVRAIASEIAYGGLALIVGPGVGVREGAPTRADLASFLAERCGYPGHDPFDFSRISEYFELVLGRDVLVKVVRDFFGRRSTSDAYRNLGRLPATAIVDAHWGDEVIRALRKERKEPRQMTFWSADFTWTSGPTAGEPVVLKLYGSFHDPSSMAITTADDLMAVRRMDDAESIRSVLSTEFTRRVVLAVGVSMTAPLMRMLLDWLSLDRYALRLYVVDPFPDTAMHAYYRRHSMRQIATDPIAFIDAVVAECDASVIVRG